MKFETAVIVEADRPPTAVMTVAAAARELGTSKPTVRKHMRSGLLQPQHAGTTDYLLPDQVVALGIARQQIQAGAWTFRDRSRLWSDLRAGLMPTELGRLWDFPRRPV